MDFGFNLAHGGAVVREGYGGIGGVGAMIDGMRDFGDRKRVDKMSEVADV